MADRSDLPGEVADALHSTPGNHGSEREAARRSEALSLRLAGLSFDTIGERLGISGRGAQDLVGRTLEASVHRNVALMREEENARLDRAQVAIWNKVLEGDAKAIASFLAISRERSRINGLYAPTQLAITMSIKQEMDDALAALEEMVMQPLVIHESEPRDITGTSRPALDA